MIQEAHSLQSRTETLPADVALRELTNDPDLYIFGHGTPSAKSAQNIIENGLHLRSPELRTTTVEMESSVENPDAVRENTALLEKWPHQDHKFVAVVGIQRYEEGDAPHSYYLQSVVQPRSDIEDEDMHNHREQYVIDRRFLAGYFDADKGEFVRNPGFDPTYDKQLLDTSADLTLVRGRQQRQRVSAMEHLSGPAVDAQILHPVPHDGEDDSDAWVE